jgi:transcriptional regulator with XRE-family HTH domain
MQVKDTKIPGRILRPDIKARTAEILADLEVNEIWRLPAQRAIASVLFWMKEMRVTKRALAEKMEVSEQAMGKLLKLDSDFKLSTIGRLAQATGLDLFSIMASKVYAETTELRAPELSKLTTLNVIVKQTSSGTFWSRTESHRTTSVSRMKVAFNPDNEYSGNIATASYRLATTYKQGVA